ncbi:lyase family protein [Tepidamorphus sp. 3E244]|uniref:lyase family protein n=1 Tax=Tepidamorphus sp. 3E244 TaxID=3385498 RepID=UPI0038FCA0CA
MSVSPLDSALHVGGLNDPQVSQLFSDDAQIAAMLRVEGALARAQGALDIIPSDCAKRIEEVCEAWSPDPGNFAPGTARDGVPVPVLVAGLRKAVGEEAASYVHFGATSQDIADTAFLLSLKSALDVVGTRMDELVAMLANLADAHRPTLCLARTRGQAAVPTVFGLKAANWLAPIAFARDEMDPARENVLAVSLGGAAGTMSALGPAAFETAAAMARILRLGEPAAPWHAQRERMAGIANWAAMACGAFGKMGADMMVLAQGEVGEIGFEGAGGSSTMPNKANPVSAELLVALANHASALASSATHMQLAANERDGAAWMLEWLTLPPLVCACGAASARALEAVGALRVDARRMRANLDATNGTVLAEAATFALLEAGYSRTEAAELVKRACRQAGPAGGLIVVLRELVPGRRIDWDALENPANAIGLADELIDRIIAEAGSDGD